MKMKAKERGEASSEVDAPAAAVAARSAYKRVLPAPAEVLPSSAVAWSSKHPGSPAAERACKRGSESIYRTSLRVRSLSRDSLLPL